MHIYVGPMELETPVFSISLILTFSFFSSFSSFVPLPFYDHVLVTSPLSLAIHFLYQPVNQSSVLPFSN